MQDFQQRVLEDLRGRIDDLREKLQPSLADSDRSRFARPAVASLDQLDAVITQITTDPRYQDHRFDQQHRIMLQRINEGIFIVESVVVPSLERFNLSDRRLTRLTAKLVEQINWPLPAPLVVLNSEGGYMSLPGFDLVRLPAAEDGSLLALPDVVHELTHLLLVRERGTLVGDFVAVAAQYVRDQQASQPPLPPHVFELWRGPWLEELVSDMVAAYVCGGVFGEQHIRLISTLPTNAYRGGKTHPPDEARARGAAAVLRAMGHPESAAGISEMLTNYLPTVAEPKPRDYDRMVPDELIDALAQRVVAGCDRLGIRRFDAPEVSRPDDIVGVIREAWQQFTTTTVQAFSRWQKGRLGMLWRQLGVGDPGIAAHHRVPTPRPRPGTRPVVLVPREPELAA